MVGTSPVNTLSKPTAVFADGYTGISSMNQTESENWLLLSTGRTPWYPQHMTWTQMWKCSVLGSLATSWAIILIIIFCLLLFPRGREHAWKSRKIYSYSNTTIYSKIAKCFYFAKHRSKIYLYLSSLLIPFLLVPPSNLCLIEIILWEGAFQLLKISLYGFPIRIIG